MVKFTQQNHYETEKLLSKGRGGQERASPVPLPLHQWEDACLNASSLETIPPTVTAHLLQKGLSYRNGVYLSKKSKNSLYDSLLDRTL